MIDYDIGIKCPYCKSVRNRVLSTKTTQSNCQRRRRECTDCGRRFNTFEVISEDVPSRRYIDIDVNEVEAEQILSGKLSSWIIKNCEVEVGDWLQFKVHNIDNECISSTLDGMKFVVTCTLYGTEYGLSDNCSMCGFTKIQQ